MEKVITAAAITACPVLCAAVWPQPDTREEQPPPMPTHAAAAPEADVTMTAEKEYAEVLQTESAKESGAGFVPVSADYSALSPIASLFVFYFAAKQI